MTDAHTTAHPHAQRLPHLSRRASFWVVAYAFLTITALSTAPSPLYGIYARRDGFSSLTTTVVYGVYVIGLVASLLLAGHVSDWYGRRAVMVPGLVVAIAAVIVFIVGKSLGAAPGPAPSSPRPGAFALRGRQKWPQVMRRLAGR